METTEQSNDKLTISEREKSPEPQFSAQHKAWIIDQVTVVAETFGESLTPVRLRVYAENLADIGQEQLARAFQRAVRELTFFPKVAELRKLADADEETRTELEAERAWQLVERDLARNGKDARSHLDACTEYAIRCAGGRLGINACFSASITDEAFCKKRFIEAFGNYDAAQYLGLAQLPAAVSNAVGEITSGARKALPAAFDRDHDSATTKVAKPIPQPLTDAEIEARRAMLAQQAAQLRGDSR